MIDTSKKGLLAVLKDWQVEVVKEILKDAEKRWLSAEVQQYINKKTAYSKAGGTISRASAINFLADMAKQGVINVGEATGKGGHHAVYHAAMTAQGYGAYIIKEVVEKIAETFPESKDAFIAAVEASFKVEEKK